MFSRLRCCFVLLLATVAATTQAAEGPFPEGRSGQGQLKYCDHVPVLIVQGTPAEMGHQAAVLTRDAVKQLSGYPQMLMLFSGHGGQWPKCLEAARSLSAHAAKDHREEMAAFAAEIGGDRDLIYVANTLMDWHRGGVACSSLIVAPGKSRSGQVLFGRNLDFFTLGLLDKYSLVTVYRPHGKHALVSVGFPGLMGCLSGMNDAGLALAVHEVFATADGAPRLDTAAMPYALCFRRILEECSTVKEAEDLLRHSKRSTVLNLAVCDRHGGAVLEMTPRSVVLRRGEDGLCACTNHFRSKPLRVNTQCARYDILAKAASLAKLDVADVAHKLDEVNMGARTVQSMIFEPGPLVLHLAIGSPPVTKAPLRTLELSKLLGRH